MLNSTTDAFAEALDNVITRDKILEKLPRPSFVIEAMMHGLIKMGTNPKYSVYMGTYGETVGGICYGCAATGCIIEVFPQVPINALERYTQNSDLRLFEQAVDSFRTGHPYALFNLYDLNIDDLPEELHRSLLNVNLRDHDWEKQLPLLIEIVRDLRKLGM